MTRIVGIISWFDESPTWLASTIASMARICDHVIAVDGRFALYDDPKTVSPMAQHDAIVHAARGAGMGCTLMVPTRPWRDEMTKRTACFELAQLVTTVDVDWAFILDGDEVLVEAPEKAGLIDWLDDQAERGVRVVQAVLRDNADPHATPERTNAGMRLPNAVSTIDCYSPRLWRLGRSMRVEGYHFNYLGEDADGSTLEFWGDDQHVRNRPMWTEARGLVIEHRHEQRAQVRKAAREQYYRDRNDTGLEAREPLTTQEAIPA